MPITPPSSNKPTLEELLRLKRSERPPQAFWSEFDTRLREKQLAALIPVSSGWSQILSGLGRFAKLGLPLAATAAVVVGVVSFNRQIWQSDQSQVNGQRSQDLGAAQLDSPAVAPLTASNNLEAASPIRTVVIEAGSNTMDPAATASSSNRNDRNLNAAEISRTLPWLANVDLKRDEGLPGLRFAESLQVKQVPPGMTLNVFENTRSAPPPAWAPTEHHIRAAVASEIGIASSFADKTQASWATRTVATKLPSRFMESRIESEYRGEIPRVGLTASTLSIKF